MKIAMIVTGLALERTGGAEWASLNTSKALASQGVEVHVFTPLWGGRKTSREPLENLHIHYTNNINADRRLGYTSGIMKFSRICRRRIKELGPDIVHGWTLFPPSEIAAACSRYLEPLPGGRNAFVIGCRNFIDVISVNPGSMGMSSSMISRAMDLDQHRKRMRLFAAAGGITTQTGFIMGLVMSVHGRDAAVIPNGLDSSAFMLPEHRDRIREKWGLTGRVIVNVGRHSPIKGQNHLIAAAPGIFSKYPDSMIVLVGDGRLHQQLRKQAAGLGHPWSERIKFTGKLDRAATREVLSGSDIFAFPSIVEGFPNAVLEAFAAGLPVAVSPLTGLPEIVEDGKNGHVASTPVNIGEAILKIMGSPEKMAAMKRANIRKAREFSWEKVGTMHKEFYEALLEGNGD